MNNPWEEISLEDYENHMKLDPVRQLQAMNKIMKEQFAAYPVKTAMVFGVAPKMDALFEYIHELAESGMVFSENLTKAIDYAINQEVYLRRFLEDGNIPCDNGSNERHIRGYSVGRANWLFADTITGAEVNAAMYSIVDTAKANNVNPYTYIKYLIEKMPEHLDKDGNITDRECLKDMVPCSDAFHTYEKECTESRNRMYSGMFPAPVIPKPPGKTAEAASKDPAVDTA